MSSGSCLCSKVHYTFTGTPALQVICHCNECHKVSGSAFTTNFIVPTTNFKITSGYDSIKSYPAQHQTGMTLTIHFCSNCGSTLYKEGDSDAFKGTVIIQVGSLDKSEGLALDDVQLAAELFVSQRTPWLKPFENAGQLQTFS